MMKRGKEMQTFKVLFSIINSYINPNYLKNYFPHIHTYFTSSVMIYIKFASWSSENQKDLWHTGRVPIRKTPDKMLHSAALHFSDNRNLPQVRKR